MAGAGVGGEYLVASTLSSVSDLDSHENTTTLTVSKLTDGSDGVFVDIRFLRAGATATVSVSSVQVGSVEVRSAEEARAGVLRGDPGDKGAPGEDGGTGPQGLQGATGAQGPPGPTGAQGATGAPGPAGPTGPPGPTGPAGVDGVSGPRGATGAVGPQGPVGDAGPSGPSGPLAPADVVDEATLTSTSALDAPDLLRYPGAALGLTQNVHRKPSDFYVLPGTPEQTVDAFRYTKRRASSDLLVVLRAVVRCGDDDPGGYGTAQWYSRAVGDFLPEDTVEQRRHLTSGKAKEICHRTTLTHTRGRTQGHVSLLARVVGGGTGGVRVVRVECDFVELIV